MPLSSRVPEIGSLDLLLTVAREGSLGKAAREHGISQPAVASRIRNLERLIGVALVVRSPSGSRLTEQGTVVVDWARRVVEAAAALDAGIAALRNQQNSKILIACSMTIAEYLLPTWLIEVRRRRPDVMIGMRVINSSGVHDSVLDGTVDLGFVEGAEVPDGVQACAVASDELLLVVAPGHPWSRRRRPVSAAELAETPLVCRESGSGTRYTLDSELARLGHHYRPEPVMELSSTTAIKAAVEAGMGPAVLSSLAIAEEVATGRLVSVPTTGLDLHRSLRVVTRSGEHLSPILRDVLAAAQGRDGHGQPRPGSTESG